MRFETRENNDKKDKIHKAFETVSSHKFCRKVYKRTI